MSRVIGLSFGTYWQSVVTRKKHSYGNISRWYHGPMTRQRYAVLRCSTYNITVHGF